MAFPPPSLPSSFVFPEGFASHNNTRDSLSKLEQQFFDSLGEETQDQQMAKAALDKIDLCHQAGIFELHDISAFVECRVTFEGLLEEQAELAEFRRKECERQTRMEKRKEGRRVEQEGKLETWPPSMSSSHRDCKNSSRQNQK